MMKHVILAIDGMSCGHCVATVQRALTELDGVTVRAVRVGEADVEYDPTTVSEETLTAAVAKHGYPATVRDEDARR
jgi:copper chaperone CopZ